MIPDVTPLGLGHCWVMKLKMVTHTTWVAGAMPCIHIGHFSLWQSMMRQTTKLKYEVEVITFFS
jgi:hypothetical protein